jgi:predicted Zn-dependent protease
MTTIRMGKKSKSGKSGTHLASESDLKKRIDTVLRLGNIARADETEVQVDETIDALTRFANNAIHQNVAEHGITISIRTVVDGRTARSTTNRLDEDSLFAAIKSSLQLAHSQPKIPGLLPMPGKQRYRSVNRFASETAATTPEDRARAVKRSCDLAIRNGQVAAGMFSTGQSQLALANSQGLFATHRQTHAEFSITMQDEPAASWAKANSGSVRNFDPQELAARASEKAQMAKDAQELAPGKYTVILEPAAVLDLVGFLFYDFAATAVADQRSCLLKRLNKPLFGKNISITDDAYHRQQLGASFDGEGIPRQRVNLVENGVPRNLVYSRASAKKAKTKPTGHGFALPNEYGEAPMNLVFSGGDSSLEKMVASTDRGLLVTRVWYIREVDPYEKIMTGMTRDGLYLVENGKVTGAVRNFRFNQSLIELLQNVEAMSPASRAAAEEAFEMVVPAMKVKNFHLTEPTKF